MVRCSIQTTDLEMTPNMHRKQKSKVRFLKDMLSSFEYSSCHRRKTTTTTKNDPTRILKVSTYRVVCVRVGRGGGTSNVLAMDARILALKSIPTKHAMPATKAAKTAAYLLKWQKC